MQFKAKRGKIQLGSTPSPGTRKVEIFAKGKEFTLGRYRIGFRSGNSTLARQSVAFTLESDKILIDIGDIL
jgi:hypothetical protein